MIHAEALQVPTHNFQVMVFVSKAECLEHSDQTTELNTLKKECREVAKQSFTKLPICITPLLLGTHILVSVLLTSPGYLVRGCCSSENYFSHTHSLRQLTSFIPVCHATYSQTVRTPAWNTPVFSSRQIPHTSSLGGLSAKY